jgi:UDP-N-acetylglucosamine:LPS N-acetylglucosamine transferase
MVPDPECTADSLGRELDLLLGDEQARSAMGAAARAMAYPDAATDVAALAEEHARG